MADDVIRLLSCCLALQQWNLNHGTAVIKRNNNAQISPDCEVISLLSVVDGVHEEIHIPGQWILVHWVYVGKISDAEKQDWRMDCDRCITHAGRVDLLLSFLNKQRKWISGCLKRSAMQKLRHASSPGHITLWSAPEVVAFPGHSFRCPVAVWGVVAPLETRQVFVGISWPVFIYLHQTCAQVVND